MAGVKWTPGEIKKLKTAHQKKQSWVTDYELARILSGQFGKSPEAIRWQLRQFKRNVKVEVSYPKILLLDIETLPIEANIWATKKVFVSPVQIKKDWSIVCWSAKWLFSGEAYGETVSPQEAINREDKSILAGIWTLLDEADMVISYNGDGFDLKRLNTKFFVHGFPPPMYYKSVDVWKTVSSKFDFTYQKMDWVNKVLGISRKMDTSFKWWNECAQGSKVYLKKMLEYNLIDVHVLEELYLKIRPWISNHPDMNVFSIDGKVCHNCGNDHLDWCGKYTTPKNAYKAFRCQRCGAIGRAVDKKHKLGKV